MFDNTSDEDKEFFGDTMPEFNVDSFMELPAFVNTGLTPEQIRHRSQVYQVAFEKARETVIRKNADSSWMKQNGLTFGDGI
jgi:hypothetical protein